MAAGLCGRVDLLGGFDHCVVAIREELHMSFIDWAVMFSTLAGIVSYGWWRGRRNRTTDEYLLAGRSMPWYAMALSIMATQASAVTFISTTVPSLMTAIHLKILFGLLKINY